MGDDALFPRSRAAGADGIVSAIASAVPELVVAADRVIHLGQAERLQGLECRLREFLFMDRFVPGSCSHPEGCGIARLGSAKTQRRSARRASASWESSASGSGDGSRRLKKNVLMPEKLVAFLFLVLAAAAAQAHVPGVSPAKLAAGEIRSGVEIPRGLKPTLRGLVPGPQVLTFFSDVDDSDQPYAVYLPKEFDAGKKYPLVISLHGAWSNHRLNLRRVFGKGQAPGRQTPRRHATSRLSRTRNILSPLPTLAARWAIKGSRKKTSTTCWRM